MAVAGGIAVLVGGFSMRLGALALSVRQPARPFALACALLLVRETLEEGPSRRSRRRFVAPYCGLLLSLPAPGRSPPRRPHPALACRRRRDAPPPRGTDPVVGRQGPPRGVLLLPRRRRPRPSPRASRGRSPPPGSGGGAEPRLRRRPRRGSGVDRASWPPGRALRVAGPRRRRRPRPAPPPLLPPPRRPPLSPSP